MDRFKGFLDGPDKGTKPRSNYQRYHDVRRIIEITRINDVATLLENDGLIIKDKYLMDYRVNHKPKPIEAGSIKKYLNSVIDFIDFLILENIKIDGLTLDTLQKTKLRIQLWRKKHGRAERLQKHVKAHADFEMMVYVTTEQVQSYENCKIAEDAKSVFAIFQANENTQLRRTSYCLMRDHLFSLIHFSTSHRSGVTANMQVTEFEKAKNCNGEWIIKVWDHKTVDYYGPASVVLTPENYQLVYFYITVIRKKLNVRSNNVFLTWSGRSISSGNNNKILLSEIS